MQQTIPKKYSGVLFQNLKVPDPPSFKIAIIKLNMPPKSIAQLLTNPMKRV